MSLRAQGFGNEHATEAIKGALPQGQNTPQKVAFGLYAEQLSGAAFTVPRSKQQRTCVGVAPARLSSVGLESENGSRQPAPAGSTAFVRRCCTSRPSRSRMATLSRALARLAPSRTSCVGARRRCLRRATRLTLSTVRRCARAVVSLSLCLGATDERANDQASRPMPARATRRPRAAAPFITTRATRRWSTRASTTPTATFSSV